MSVKSKLAFFERYITDIRPVDCIGVMMRQQLSYCIAYQSWEMTRHWRYNQCWRVVSVSLACKMQKGAKGMVLAVDYFFTHSDFLAVDQCFIQIGRASCRARV